MRSYNESKWKASGRFPSGDRSKTWSAGRVVEVPKEFGRRSGIITWDSKWFFGNEPSGKAIMSEIEERVD